MQLKHLQDGNKKIKIKKIKKMPEGFTTNIEVGHPDPEKIMLDPQHWIKVLPKGNWC
jgi:dihydroorotase